MSDQREGMERMEARYRGPADGAFVCPAGFPVPEGITEWVVGKGDTGAKGDKGDRGEKGTCGLPPGQARAVVYLFVLGVVLFVVLGVALFHYVHAYQGAQAQEQAQAHRQGQLIERKLCQTFDQLASNKAPAGNPLTNPSRAFDQRQHAILAQVAPDLGCTARR